MAGRACIGTSGFSYPHWRGVLYPEGLPQSRWLERYCELFNTVELNVTFYRLPGSSAVQGWRDRTPVDFLFSVKASRLITHRREPGEGREAVERFFSAVSLLGDKLGPVLFQFPPALSPDMSVLRAFLALLPAGRLHAFEFRHEKWFTEDVYEVLRGQNAALVLHDYGRFPCPRTLTAGWTYVRLHGPSGFYAGEYGREGLRQWADLLNRWAGEGTDAYVYFNNDDRGSAVRDAAALGEMILEN